MKQVMIRIPDQLVEKIEKMAAKETRSRSNMVRILIEIAMENKSEIEHKSEREGKG